jgi:hypothetical protein
MVTRFVESQMQALKKVIFGSALLTPGIQVRRQRHDTF